MILWCDGAHDVHENMRRDAELLRLAEGGGEPVLRLFQFQPAGITLGHSQNPADVLDLDRCASHGVSWALRPTGGRAIYHAEEWTYSIAASFAHVPWDGTLGNSYNRIANLMLGSIKALGVPMVYSGIGVPSVGPRSPRRDTAPCFATGTRHEITRDGRKLMGSAQRRTATALLQQGSLLLSDGHLALADYLAIDDDERPRMREGLRLASTHIGDVVGRAAPLGLWADALAGMLGSHVCRLEGPDALALTT